MHKFCRRGCPGRRAHHRHGGQWAPLSPATWRQRRPPENSRSSMRLLCAFKLDAFFPTLRMQSHKYNGGKSKPRFPVLQLAISPRRKNPPARSKTHKLAPSTARCGSSGAQTCKNHVLIILYCLWSCFARRFQAQNQSRTNRQSSCLDSSIIRIMNFCLLAYPANLADALLPSSSSMPS